MPSAGDSDEPPANQVPDITVLYEKIRSTLTNEDISNLRSALNSINALSGLAPVKAEPMDFDENPEQNQNSEQNGIPGLDAAANGGEIPNFRNIRIKDEPIDPPDEMPDQPVENVAPPAPVKEEVKPEPQDLLTSGNPNDVTHLWSSITGLLTKRSSEVDHALNVLQQSEVITRLNSTRDQRDTKEGVTATNLHSGSRVAAKSLPAFPPTYTSSFSVTRPKSPVRLDVRRDAELSRPPDESRMRRNRYADPIGPCLFDLYQDSLQEAPVWPGEIVIPDDIRRANEEAQVVRSGKREVAKHTGTAHIPSIFLDRVWSNVAVDLAAPTLQESVNAVRRLMRKRMHRCRYCGNRFVEIDIFERHILEKHPENLDRYRASKAKKEEKERMRYLAFKSRMKDIEDRRNQRLADQYEKTIEINRKREVLGLAPLEMEELFPPRPKRQRVLRSPSPEKDAEEDIANPDKPIKFKKRVCPQCPFCDKRYKNDMFLKKHIARKHPECIHYVQCNKCYKAVENADALASHYCDLTWICLECKPIRNMVTAARLMSHRNKFHRGEASGFKCLECERKFLTPRKLKTHKKLAHIHTRTYKCHFCDEHFIAEYQVSLHERVHTGKVKFECPICDFRCHRWVTLARHKKDDHGYLCMICGERVMEWSELKRHTLQEHEGYLSVDSQTVFLVSPRLWILYKGE